MESFMVIDEYPRENDCCLEQRGANTITTLTISTAAGGKKKNERRAIHRFIDFTLGRFLRK